MKPHFLQEEEWGFGVSTDGDLRKVKKKTMKCFFKLVILILFLFPSVAFPDVKEIICEGTYNMGDGETPTVAESRALLNAKRIAIEQAGTYLESYSKAKNFQLTHDEIQVLASGIIEVLILERKRSIVEDGFKFWVKIKTRVSTDKIEEMAQRIKDKSSAEDYRGDLKQLQENYERLTRDIEILKSQLKEAKSEKEKQQVETKITDSERLFQANEWFEKGKKDYLNHEYESAISSYTSAISLDPNFAMAYNNRGLTFWQKRDYDRTIEDCSKAITLNPNLALPYNNRGLAYWKKNLNERAIEDYNKAISIDPNFALAYNNRGLAYRGKGENDKAIENYDKAISLVANLAQAYNNRGLAYWYKGNNDKTIQDCSKAISLNPNPVDLAMAYNNRGLAYWKKGKYDNALADYNRAISLDPNLAMAYNNRGLIYWTKGENGRAIEDYNKAISLDPNLKLYITS